MPFGPTSRTRLRSALGLSPVGALFFAQGLTACSGDRFSSGAGNGAAGRAMGGTAGDAAAGGLGGAGLVGMGGASAAAGAGGGSAGMVTAGGRGGESCGCGAGEYCRAGTCYDCADLGQLDFAAPEALRDEADGVRFPRQGATSGSLFFMRVLPGQNQLWYLPDLGTELPVSLANGDAASRAALLYFGDEGGVGFDVLFDEVGPDGHRSIHTAGWEGEMLVNAGDAPSPLSAGGFDDYSVAFAATARRAYWMTTRDGAPTLRTGTLGSGDVVVVDVMIPAQSGGGVTCARQGDDATPWVTSDGKIMLLSALPLDGSCAPVDGDASDLYIALLDATTGLPRANATVAISAVNRSTDRSSETDASFSADLCALYFASDGGEVGGHDYRLYRAARR